MTGSKLASFLAKIFSFKSECKFTFDTESPFFLALKEILSQERTLYPEDHEHGVFDLIPLKAWTTCDIVTIDKEARRVLKKKKNVVESAKALLKTGLPSFIKDALLRPLPADESECEHHLDPADKTVFFFDISFEGEFDEEMKEKAARAMTSYCVCAYLWTFISFGEDPVKGLQHPGNPELKLTINQRLCLGLIREMIILPHFPNLKLFWDTLGRLRKDGWNLICYMNWEDEFDRNRLKQLLRGDQEALKMYEVVVALGQESDSFTELLGEFNWYVSSPKGPLRVSRYLTHYPLNPQIGADLYFE